MQLALTMRDSTGCRLLLYPGHRVDRYCLYLDVGEHLIDPTYRNDGAYEWYEWLTLVKLVCVSARTLVSYISLSRMMNYCGNSPRELEGVACKPRTVSSRLHAIPVEWMLNWLNDFQLTVVMPHGQVSPKRGVKRVFQPYESASFRQRKLFNPLCALREDQETIQTRETE